MILSLSSLTLFGQWNPKGSVGGGKSRGAFVFTIGGKAYVGGGDRGGNFTSTAFWEWDQATDVWTQKAAAKATWLASGFSIGNKGYVVGGDIGCQPFISGPCFEGTNSLREYDPASNTWSNKASVGGNVMREQAVAFSIGNLGYVTTGTDKYTCPANGNISMNDMWQYNPTTDSWTQMANLPANARYGATGFTIGTKGYVLTGMDSNNMFYADFWEWEQTTNTWTAKANFPGTARSHAAGFAMNGKGYIGTGVDKLGNNLNDFWMWDQASNTWMQKQNFFGLKRFLAIGFSINGKGYIGLGDSGPICNDPQKVEESDFWEYTDCGLLAAMYSDPSTTVCVGQSVYITATGGVTYSWNTGSTDNSIVVNPTITTTYSVTVTDGNGCSGVSTITIPVDPNCTSTSVGSVASNNSSVSIQPNPFNESAILNISGVAASAVNRLVIYDVMGKEVRNTQFTGSQYALEKSGLEDGIYFYTVVLSNNSSASGKFVISSK